MVMEKTGEVGGEISTQDQDAFCGVGSFCKSGDPIRVEGVSKFLQAPDVVLDRFPDVSGKTRSLGLAGLHGVQRGRLGHRERVNEVLKLAVACKTHFPDASDHRRRIHFESLSQFPNIQQNKCAWVFKQLSETSLVLAAEHCDICR